MGTTLTGTTPQDTYDSLIKVTDNGPLSATAKYLSDGLGNDSALALSTSMVGINTTTPSLQGFNNELTISSGVSGTKRTALNLQGSRTTASTFASIGFYHQANFVASIESSRGGADNSASLEFFTSDAGPSAERMRILATGNVGIGTSSPASKLAVQGEIRSNDSGGYAALLASTALGYSIVADTHVSGGIAMFTAGTERARFTANGLTFNGDTAAANALDDYEEGTFTATLKGSTTDPTTAVTTTGNYTKIGRQVTISIMFANVNTTGASGSVTVLGVPFSCVTAGVGSAITENFTFGATRTTVSSLIDSAAATTIRFSVSGNDTSFENLSHNAGSGRYLYTSLTYFV